MSGIASAQGTFDGSFGEPRFSLDVNATGVRYEEETYGNRAPIDTLNELFGGSRPPQMGILVISSNGVYSFGGSMGNDVDPFDTGGLFDDSPGLVITLPRGNSDKDGHK